MTDTERLTRLEAAVDDVLRAIAVEGIAPQYHRNVMRTHRAEWPTLWKALDNLKRARR